MDHLIEKGQNHKITMVIHHDWTLLRMVQTCFIWQYECKRMPGRGVRTFPSYFLHGIIFMCVFPMWHFHFSHCAASIQRRWLKRPHRPVHTFTWRFSAMAETSRFLPVLLVMVLIAAAPTSTNVRITMPSMTSIPQIVHAFQEYHFVSAGCWRDSHLGMCYHLSKYLWYSLKISTKGFLYTTGWCTVRHPEFQSDQRPLQLGLWSPG